MADWTPYKITTPAAEAAAGIAFAAQAAKVGGILKGNGQGGVSTATPGTDYGLGLLKGNGAPGSTTVGSLGQHYFDLMATHAPYEYICIGFTEAGFVWKVYGDTGAGFTLKGRFSSLEALQEAIESGTVDAPEYGDAYFIGEAQPYDVYYYSKTAGGWENIGPLGNVTPVGGLPKSGKEGQVLIKSSDVDYDATWGSVLTAGSVKSETIEDKAVTYDKLETSAKYSPVANAVSTPYIITADDIGKTLIATSGDYVFRVNKNDAIPVGAEIAILREGADSVQIAFGASCNVGIMGNKAYIAGATLNIPKMFGMAALKKIKVDGESACWIVTGNAKAV